MKISTKGRYALEALLYMAAYCNEEPVNIRQISEGTGISERYLEQLFFLLRKAGILDTQRGPKGGYYILPELSSLTAGTVIRVVEVSLVPVACVTDKTKCGGNADSCATRQLWVRLTSAINEVLDGVTLQDLKNDLLRSGVQEGCL